VWPKAAHARTPRVAGKGHSLPMSFGSMTIVLGCLLVVLSCHSSMPVDTCLGVGCCMAHRLLSKPQHVRVDEAYAPCWMHSALRCVHCHAWAAGSTHRHIHHWACNTHTHNSLHKHRLSWQPLRLPNCTQVCCRLMQRHTCCSCAKCVPMIAGQRHLFKVIAKTSQIGRYCMCANVILS
jgi:hypothetical protein